MICPSCAHENRPSAKFCEECATPLKLVCASCGAELRPTAKFCDECGAPAGAGPGAAASASDAARDTDTRKVVTIVFADLVGSTALHERLDAESARRFMESYYVAMRGAVEAQGGTVTQLLGDGVKAVFGIPRVAEDDASRAVRAAVAMQDAFRTLPERQRGAVGATGLRVAVNTGEVVANDATEIIGDPVNVAARLQEQGRDGDVVVGESTHRLVATLVMLELLGSFALKGRSEAVRAYRVLSLERPAGVAVTAFVGRDEEMARLGSVYETAIESPAAALAVLIGSPGLGKSRLIDEFARRFGESATVVRAQCDAAGGATFAPLALALRELLGREHGASADGLHATIEAALPGDDAERSRIVAGIGALLAGSPASPEETFFVVRRLLAGLGRAKPVVLVIDDLQWAAPLLLDLVEHLVQWGSGVRLLVLVGARPELRELRSSLVTPGGLVADVVTLAGLDAGAAMRLAANAIGAADLPSAVAAKVLATSEGNPLFVAELVRMLVQEGALTREGERWTIGAGLASLEMPPTIHALLAARIEGLRPEERAVLERAAVVGRHFSRNAVAELLPQDAEDLDARLESLRRSELIEADTGWFLGEPVLRFHHVLVRDAAYRRILKGTRAELHARVADWIEARAGDTVEHDETIGWHLEQAHRHLLELGPIDERGRALGERASTRLASAGRRALARDDVSLAAGLLGRALDRLDNADPARADLVLDACEALLSAGDVGSAAAAIDELDRFAASSERLRAWHTCYACQLSVLTAPEELQATADAVVAAAEALAEQGDAAGEAKAYSVHAQALARLGRIGACEAALDRALAAARRAGDRRRANAVLAGAPLAALWGPSPVTRASGRFLDVVRVLRITQGAPAVEATALSCQGLLEALRGRTDAARRMLASSRELVEELGITQRLLEVDVFEGRVELLEGDAVAAERCLHGAYEGLRDAGLGIDAAQAAALLARALLAQDRAVEAEAFSHESEALAGDDLQAAIAWRGVRAEALARRDEHSASIELAHAAVAIASATDALLDHADARAALAAALRAAGRGGEADAEDRRVTELWQAKGATLLAERAWTDSARDAGVAAAPSERRFAPDPVVQRRVRPNAVTAAHLRVAAALAASDFEAVAAVFAESYEEVDHSTGSTYGRDAAVASVERLMRDRDPSYRMEPLATLGDSVALFRRRVRARGTSSGRFDVGEYDNEAIHLLEVDERGLFWCSELFAANRHDAAASRLYERHADNLPEGRERARAIAAARSLVTVMLAVNDLDRLSAVLAPDFESVDHRHLSTWSFRSADAFIEHMRALQDVADHIAFRTQEVLALEPNALLIRRMHSGTERVGGGAYERPFLALFATDADGQLSHAEWFDADREADALACFDALAASEAPLPAALFANAAWRRLERLLHCWEAHDWKGVEGAFSRAFRFDDRRRLNRIEVGAEDFLLQFRMLFDQPASRWQRSLLASRGERLALGRTVYQAEVEGGGGPLEFSESFAVYELGADGRFTSFVLFDREDAAAAWAELDARYEAGEAAADPHSWASIRDFVRGVASRDWDSVVALCAEELVEYDHRGLAVIGTTHGAAAWVQNFRTLAELSPDTVYRVDHFRAGARGFYSHGGWHGTREGGRYEIPLNAVLELDGGGRIARADIYDDEGVEAALARFAELVAPEESPPERFSNAATRTLERGTAALAARDWEGFAALFAADFRSFDRRALAHLDSDREQWLASLRQIVEMTSSPPTREVLATRGDRLALARVLWQGAEGDIGPSELDWLLIIEADESGDHSAVVTFDPDDLDAAYADLDARWAAGEASLHPRASARAAAFRSAFASRDWEAMALLTAPDLVARNHRLVGWGTRHGPAAMVSTLRELVALAPDVEMRVDHLRTSERGILWAYAWQGTRDGGAFETPLALVIELDDAGLQRHLDVWDADMQGAALARFEEISATAPRDPLAAIARPNAASAPMDRWRDARDVGAATGEWEAMRALCAPDMVFEDRQRRSLVSGDREMMIASVRERAAMDARPSATLVGTAGDLVALMRMLWSGGPPEGRFEIEHLVVVEVDASGLFTATIPFDLDDPRAAQREAWGRWAAIEPAAAELTTVLGEIIDATNTQDRARYRAQLADDLVVVDHRHTGMGRLTGADAHLASIVALWERAPGGRVELGWLWPAQGLQGAITVARFAETSADGGAFESLFLYLFSVSRGRIAHIELFEIDALDAALARFGEISATAPRDPLAAIARPNLASAYMDLFAASDPSDWDLVARAGRAPDSRWEDRRRLFLLSGDFDLMIASLRERAATGARIERHDLVASAGDRVAIHRVLWAGGPPEGRFEMEYLVLLEMDEAGRGAALMLFDLDDAHDAQREAWALWGAIDPAVAPLVAALSEATDAFNARDRERLRRLFAEDIVVEDHRRTGMGRIEGGGAYADSYAVLWDLASVARIELGRFWPAFGRHGALTTIRLSGDIADGGAFESDYLYLFTVADGRIAHLELFELDALDVALARFEEVVQA